MSQVQFRGRAALLRDTVDQNRNRPASDLQRRAGIHRLVVLRHARYQLRQNLCDTPAWRGGQLLPQLFFRHNGYGLIHATHRGRRASGRDQYVRGIHHRNLFCRFYDFRFGRPQRPPRAQHQQADCNKDSF